MSKKVLITGHAGFSGKHLINYLSSQKDIELIGIDIKKSGLIKEFTIDLTKYDLVNPLIGEISPDYIIHLTGINYSIVPDRFYTINVNTTLNVLNAVKENQLFSTRILLISSAAVYGKQEILPLQEDLPLYPVNLYGLSKKAMEETGLFYHKFFNLDIKIVRPFNLIGPGLDKEMSVSSFISQVIRIKEERKGNSLKTGNLHTKRDFIDIRDVVSAYWAVLELGKSGEIYNIGSGNSVEMHKILEMIIKTVNVEVTIEQENARIRAFDILESRAEITKLKNLGWKPDYTLEQSLKDMAVINNQN